MYTGNIPWEFNKQIYEKTVFVSGLVFCMEGHCNGQKLCQWEDISRKEVICNYRLLFFLTDIKQFIWLKSPILCLIVSITKFSIVIGSPRVYLSRNQRAITWVSNYRCPI